MHFQIPRFPDGLVLAKAEKVAQALAIERWQFTVTGEHHQLFSLELAAKTKSPWKKNSVSAVLADSSGYAGYAFTLIVDGHHVFQLQRQNEAAFDKLTVQQQWFGDNQEVALQKFVIASDMIGAEFGANWNSKALSGNLSDDLSRFVTTRDEGLARLESLYAKFSRELVEDREQLRLENEAKQKEADAILDARRQELQREFAQKEAKLAEREGELDGRIKKIDDRDAKHARRALRDSIIAELNKRDSSFTLTKGTQRLRWPVWGILIVGCAVFLGGLVHNAYISKEVFAGAVEGWSWSVVYFVLKQVTYTAGLLSVIFFGIKWSDRWFREHANEEFKAKTMQIDILRANWVVETLLEWKNEGNQIPSELLARLTHNLFRYPDESHMSEGTADLASLLLGSAAKAKLKLGPDHEIELSKAGAKKLSNHLASVKD